MTQTNIEEFAMQINMGQYPSCVSLLREMFRVSDKIKKIK